MGIWLLLNGTLLLKHDLHKWRSEYPSDLLLNAKVFTNIYFRLYITSLVSSYYVVPYVTIFAAVVIISFDNLDGGPNCYIFWHFSGV